MATILVADDELSIRTILSKTLEKKGYHVFQARQGDEAMRLIEKENIDVAILDIRMPGLTGLQVLEKIKSISSPPETIVITAQDSMENAVAAMKQGAFDYLTKPFDLEEVCLVVDRAVEKRELRSELKELKKHIRRDKPTIVGKTKVMTEIFKTIGRIADQDVTVLIEGESGTGKELVARAIHFQGKRAAHPFIAVNCSAIPAELLESELFGSRRGAYTGSLADRIGYFERANLGTLFLDEIGDIPLHLQPKLLRVLQEQEIQKVGENNPLKVDVRVIAATNKSLADLVKKGNFREDLFFRLNVVPLLLSPLRDRREDIPLLVDYFLERCARDFGENKTISETALDYLKKAPWLGNIRELENILKRAYVLGHGPMIELTDVSKSAPEYRSTKSNEDLESLVQLTVQSYLQGETTTHLLEKISPLFEKPLYRTVLAFCQGNQIKASRILGINRNTLRRKLKELGLSITHEIKN